jgi:hypothetical protein
MQKQAVVQGTANQPRLVSRGWQQFLTQRPSDLASGQSQKSEPKSIDLPQMRNLMLRHFDENELEDLCFDLRVDYEQLAGDEKRKKTRSLINKMERENRLPELIDLCTQIRPHVDWSDTS